MLDEAVERISHYGIEVIPRVETGDAAAVLLELSEDADLMVVGSRGHGALSPVGAVGSCVTLILMPRRLRERCPGG